MQKSKRAWLHIFKHITSIVHLDVGRLTVWICAVRSSRVCWYVVWRWFYVHNIDYAKQFMFVYRWMCFLFLRIGNDDLPTDSLPMFGISFFIFTVSHLRRYFIFSAHSQWEFLFQIISIKMVKKKISGWMCGRWNIKINITTESFYILLSWFYMNMCSRMCLHLQVAWNDSPGRGKKIFADNPIP